MISNFSNHSHQINEARKDTAVIAFGRMNPPTIGHGVLVKKIIAEAQKRNADHFIFVSSTQDVKKNPLSHKQKVEYLKKFFPNGNFPLDKAKDPYSAVLYVCSLGYKNIVMVAGSDQVENFKTIGKYKGKTAERDPLKRKYSFDTFEVTQAGEARDDESQGVEGMSASKMRAAAFSGDFKSFAGGVPSDNGALQKKMWKDVRKGLQLKEEYISEETDNDHGKVTILALTSSEKDLSDTVEKMQALCKKRKIEFYAIKTSKAQIDISNVVSDKILIKNYDGEGKNITITPGNTVAIVRGGVMNADIGVAIMSILQNNGVFMINERGGMELCANKLETAIALKKHELPHPRTAFVANEENIETAVKEIGGKFPVIVKTLTGAEGIGVSKIESMESLKSVLQTLWKYGAEVIMQEFLPDFKNDVRSIVLNGKIFACAKRDKAPKDFRTNIARGSKGGAMQLTDEEIKLVERAARVSKCYYVGVDHVINDGKPYIIEMNASPGSGNIYYRYYKDGKGKNNVKGEELVEDFLDYIINKANWKLFSNLAVREEVKIDGVDYTAKIDTGNSGYNMIHGEEIKDNNDHTVTFKLPNGKKITKKIVSRITVKSGIGKKQRLVILMDMEFHGKKYPNIKFSIGDRSHMSSKVLIGLQFLSKTGMVVDPSDAIYPQPDPKLKGKGEEEEEEEIEVKNTTSKYTANFKVKTLKNQYEVEEALAAIRVMEKLEYNTRLNKAIFLEHKSIQGGRNDAAVVYRSFIDHEKNNLYKNYTAVESTLDEGVEYLLLETSPPSGAARRFSKKEKIKKSFQKQYGKDWKSKFYATAWKMHNDSYEPNKNMIESAIEKIHIEIVKESAPQSWTWTDRGVRGPVLIGTNKIANTYKNDTPGERERLNEVADEEKDDIYKEWSKLVNMSSKELSNFIDSDEGKEAGLSRKESGKAGASGGKIKSGRDSARAIVRMLDRKKDSWEDNDWAWAKRQINFINRMKGAKGSMRETDGKPTRKLLALKIWGHNPEKK